VHKTQKTRSWVKTPKNAFFTNHTISSPGNVFIRKPPKLAKFGPRGFGAENPLFKGLFKRFWTAKRTKKHLQTHKMHGFAKTHKPVSKTPKTPVLSLDCQWLTQELNFCHKTHTTHTHTKHKTHATRTKWTWNPTRGLVEGVLRPQNTQKPQKRPFLCFR